MGGIDRGIDLRAAGRTAALLGKGRGHIGHRSQADGTRGKAGDKAATAQRHILHFRSPLFEFTGPTHPCWRRTP
ncbi:hypothetical protein ACFB49_38220 [Sphingomonas sp. DBB INV C78]